MPWIKVDHFINRAFIQRVYDRLDPTALFWSSAINLDRLFRKRYILPTEHGSWIWWIGGLLIGASASGSFNVDLLWLTLTMFAAFLFRQPVTILVKSLSGRRPGSDRTPALVWSLTYSVIMLIGFLVLLERGHNILLFLALPGIPVFTWHLWLVSRRKERGQRGIEIVGAGVLALAAPAAYWVSGGNQNDLAWILWGLTWLQSAASIVLVYLRLEQRIQAVPGELKQRFQTGLRTMGYHLFNLAIATYFYLQGAIPILFVAAFGIMLIDALDGVIRPAIGVKPTRIGIRQLSMSSLFIVMSVLGFLFK